MTLPFDPVRRGSQALLGLALPALLLVGCAEDMRRSESQGADAELPDGQVAGDAAGQGSVDAGSLPTEAGIRLDSTVPPVDASPTDAETEDAQSVLDSAVLPPTFLNDPVENPPSHLGTIGSSTACTQSFRTIGHAPAP